MRELFRGDTWELEYKILDTDGTSLDLTDWEIRCEIANKAFSIKKANNKVVGGNDTQIKVLDTIGNIKIMVTKEESTMLELAIFDLEVEITSPQGKCITIVKDTIKVIKDIITWKEK